MAKSVATFVTEADRIALMLPVVESLLEAHTDWIESDQETIEPGEPVWLRTEELIAVWGEGTIPSDLRALASVIAGPLYDGWKEFVTRYRDSDAPEHELPSDAYWSAIESLREALSARNEPRLRPLEPIRCSLDCQPTRCRVCLYGQDVSPRQIARIYGWMLVNGEPDVSKALEEIHNPGKHTKDYIDPRRREHDRQLGERRALVARAIADQRAKLERLTQPPPESIEELIRAEVSARQIARIHKTSVEAVWSEADRLGLPRPALDYRSANATRGLHENRPNESLERMLPSEPLDSLQEPNSPAAQTDQPSSDEQQVLDLFTGGMSLADVARTTGMTKKRVQQILDSLERESNESG